MPNGLHLFLTLMPLLGSLADLAGNKRKIPGWFDGTGAVACAALGVPQMLLLLVVYVIAAIMFNGSMVFTMPFSRRHNRGSL